MDSPHGRVRGIGHWRAECGDKSHARFGGGLPEKGSHTRIPRRQPTLRAQVLKIDNDGEVREMRNAATVLAITHYEHWRAGCPESGHVRFGGGPSEKDPISGTSPAAYPTCAV
jgi:hypothetical protein